MKWVSGQKSKSSYWLVIVATPVVIAALFTAYMLNREKPAIVTSNTSLPSPTPTPPLEKHAKLMAVGDMLIHDDVYDAFRIGQTDTFDFRPAFSLVKPIIQSGDFNIVNQETIIGGVGLGLSGLYVANSPQELGDAFIDTGFNIIQMANNHAFDRGLDGINSALDFWSKHTDKAITSGVYTSQSSRDTTPVIEKNGIKLAFLSYSFGSNRGTGPNSYNINLINKDLIKADIEQARNRADVVVVGVHWGIENTQQVSGEQTGLAQYMADNGADIIYGTHPHELQPPAWITASDGRPVFVMYSLGNFLSIDTMDAPRTLTGAIMGLDIIKTNEGLIKLSNPFAVLTWNYYTANETDFKVMPFDTVGPGDYRWGDWPAYKSSVESLVRQSMPDMSLLSSTDF